MNNVEVFKNEDFGEIRTVMVDEEPWFVGKDITDVLGYINASKALRDHVDDDDKLNNESLSSLGQRGGWLINESGMYSLVLSSKLESAKKFKHWVTSEVLPSIRKHGAYMTEQTLERALTSPDFLIQLATNLKQEQEKNRFLAQQVEEKTEVIEQLQPKVSYYDMILQCGDLLSMTEISKDYGMSAKKMNQLLKDNGVQYFQSGRWFLYARYEGCGYTQSKTHSVVHKDGTPGAKTHMYWTQKGRLFLYDFLKKQGIVPSIEKEEVG